MRIEDLTKEGHPQIYCLCGRAERSSLRVLRHGISVVEMAVSEMPGKPIGVWTLKADLSHQYDKYMIVSFINATMVLSIQDKVVEVPDSGFDTKKQTVHVALLEDGAVVQIIPNGIIHISPNKKRNQWQTSGNIIRFF